MAEINEDINSSLEHSSTQIPDLSITAGEKAEERKETAKELSREMFSKIAEYVNGELMGKLHFKALIYDKSNSHWRMDISYSMSQVIIN